MQNNKFLLNGKWRLYIEENKKCRSFAEEITTEKDLKSHNISDIPATVPGNFELDMFAHGLIDDPFFGDNPLKIQKLENRHLWYVCNFKADNTDNLNLVFEGVDTVADVYVNGVLLGNCENMFISHKFLLKSDILKEENELIVHIKPACIEARKYDFDVDVMAHMPYNAGSLNLRKAAHSFGWDIMPRFVSGGLWRDVYLINGKKDHIKDIYIYTSLIEDNKACLHGFFDTELSDDFTTEYSLKITGKCKDSSFEWKLDKLWHDQGEINIDLDDPLLWWPRDMGKQNLYTVKAELFYNGELVDTKEFKLGIRTIVIDRTEVTDKDGNGNFCFVVNGNRLYARGTNWVPMDAFHSRDKERLQKALEMLYDVNCNMVRCWGGNVYEDHEFFDFCDRKGILVWQDFAMGCATYPQNDRICSALKTEAIAVIKKLRQHPSIALWAGDNECDEAAYRWRSTKRNPSWNKLTREILVDVTRNYDPMREYLPSSPYVTGKVFESGKTDVLPEDHLWGPRDYYKGEFYYNANAHFASETGYHGCPSPQSLKKFLSADKVWPWQNNDQWQIHATCMELGDDVAYAFRNALMASQVKVLFGIEPENLEDFALASQISQGEADKFFIERFRGEKWRRTGIIWWNLVDGWPQISDAVVDYYYCKKLAYHFIKRSQEPVCLMISETKAEDLILVGANEYLEDKTVKYTVTDFSEDKIVASGETTLGANIATDILNIKADGKHHFYFIEWEMEGKTYKNHYVSGPAPYDFDTYVSWLKRGNLLQTEGF